MFRSREQQTPALRIFAHDVHGPPVGYAARDVRPGRATVARAVDVGTQVVETQRVDGRVCRVHVEVGSVHQRHLGPRHQLRRRHVGPGRSAVMCHVNQTVVGSHPDDVDVGVGRRDGVDHAAPRDARRRRAAVLAHVGRYLPSLPRQVRADLIPTTSAVGRLPESVRGEVQCVRVHRREEDGHGPDDAVVAVAQRPWAHVLHLTGAAVVARHPATVNDIRVQRIGGDVAVFRYAHRTPLAERDLAVIATTLHARRAALLLPTANPVRKRVVGGDVVELRRRLVVPRTPRLAAVDRDDGSLVGGDEDDVGIVRVDPEALIVVATGRAADRLERAATVGGLPHHDGTGKDNVRVVRVYLDLGEIGTPLGDPGIVVGEIPALAGVVGAVQPAITPGLHGGEKATWHAWCHRDADAAETVVGEGGEPLSQWPPRVTAIGRLEESAARAAEYAVLPRTLPRFPKHRVHGLRVARVKGNVDAARVFIFIEDLLERAAPVRRAKNASLFIGTVRVAQDGHEQPVRIVRIDDDLRDLLTIAESQMGPGLTGVGGLVDTVAGRQVGSLETLATSYIDDVRIRQGDGDGTDRAGGLVVEDRSPDAAVVGRLPDAAVDDADVEHVGLTGNPRCGLRATTPERPDHAPMHLVEQVGIVLLSDQLRLVACQRNEAKNDR